MLPKPALKSTLNRHKLAKKMERTMNKLFARKKYTDKAERENRNTILVILSITILAMIGITILDFVSFERTAQEQIERTLIYGAVVVVAAIAFVLTLFGYPLLGQLLVPLAAWGTTSYAVWVSSDGFHDIAMMGLAASIALASLTLGYVGPIIIGALSLVTVVLIGWAELNSILINRLSVYTSVTDVIILSIIVVSISGVLTTVMRTFKKRIEQVQKANEDMQQTTDELLGLRASLEERVEERTRELDRRSSLLEASSYVARQASQIQDPEQLLQDVVNLITEQFGYYHAGLFLPDANEQYMILHAASSEGGKRMLARGHNLEIGRQGIVGYAAYQKRARIALDVGEESVFFNNPDLPETHSEVALPLVAQNKVIGVLDIQSTERNAFSQEDLYALQTMADQLALSIENARLLNESRLALQQLQTSLLDATQNAWAERAIYQKRGYRYTALGIAPITKAEITPNAPHILKIPVSLRGTQIGTVTLKRKNPNEVWSDREAELAADLGAQVALALENARLLEESQRRAAREQTISEISSRLSRAIDIESLLQGIARELHQIPNVTEVSVFVGEGKRPE
jgi:GAF domain-containing protein